MISFTKMHGAGNDYIFINDLKLQLKNYSDLSISMSDRHFGIGSDGIILIQPSSLTNFRMRIFNADGSEAKMCGNGLRCFAKYLYDKGLINKSITQFSVETNSGLKEITLIIDNERCDRVRISMGKADFIAKNVPIISNSEKVINFPIKAFDREFLINAVSIGNPHAVIFMKEDVRTLEIEKYGKFIQNLSMFTEGVNIEFVNICGDNKFFQRTYERGSGETLACGTGASAVFSVARVHKLCNNNATIELLGGILDLSLENDEEIILTGPAVTICDGEWYEK